MNKKKIVISITILSIGLVSFYAFKSYAEKVKDKHCLVTQISAIIFDFNSFEVTVDSTLNLNEFKVKNSGKTIFENGKSQKGIRNRYGPCTFKLFWKEEFICEFGHFRTNNWNTNKYELLLERENDKIKSSLTINDKKKRHI